MATGDLHGNLERLRVQLQSVQYPHAFDVQGLKEGIPACILPLVHYALLGYSRHLARFLSANGYELWAKSDLRFMESTLKFLRQEFNYRSALTMAQLFARGYAERKLLFLCDVIQMSKRKHNELLKVAHEKPQSHSHNHKVNHDPAKLATARRACEGACAVAVSSPFVEMKTWERTLRMPEEKAPVDTMARSESAAQATALEMEPKPHPRKMSLETTMDNDEILAALTEADEKQLVVPSRSSSKTVEHDGDNLSQVTHDNSPRLQPPSSAVHDDHHQYLLQAQPPPSLEQMSDSQDDYHFSSLQSQPPPSLEHMSDSHNDYHFSSLQSRPPPSVEQMSDSQNDYHLSSLQSRPPPSLEQMSDSQNDYHLSSLQSHPPPSSTPLSASHDDDFRHDLLQAHASPSSGPLGGSQDNEHQEQNLVQSDYHEELCQKIMEMADKLEARFCKLEDGITKARETLQDKLVSLEDRVSILETVIPHQEFDLDSAGRKLQQQQGSLIHPENGFENLDRRPQQNFLPQQMLQPAHQVSAGWQDNGFDIARWQLHLERNSEHCTPRTLFQENLQNCDCDQLLWIPRQKVPATFVDVNPYFNILNCRHSCGAGMPMPVPDQHSQTIRDISNTHQYMENNSSKLRGEFHENLFQAPEKVCPIYLEKKPLSTQDIVEDIQSRFNRTMELLYKDGQV